jgi:hypothetical protein
LEENGFHIVGYKLVFELETVRWCPLIPIKKIREFWASAMKLRVHSFYIKGKPNKIEVSMLLDSGLYHRLWKIVMGEFR